MNGHASINNLTKVRNVGQPLMWLDYNLLNSTQ